jgi:hypothetical protein
MPARFRNDTTSLHYPTADQGSEQGNQDQYYQNYKETSVVTVSHLFPFLPLSLALVGLLLKLYRKQQFPSGLEFEALKRSAL